MLLMPPMFPAVFSRAAEILLPELFVAIDLSVATPLPPKSLN
jgi:hypothetical protein